MGFWESYGKVIDFSNTIMHKMSFVVPFYIVAFAISWITNSFDKVMILEDLKLIMGLYWSFVTPFYIMALSVGLQTLLLKS